MESAVNRFRITITSQNTIESSISTQLFFWKLFGKKISENSRKIFGETQGKFSETQAKFQKTQAKSSKTQAKSSKTQFTGNSSYVRCRQNCEKISLD